MAAAVALEYVARVRDVYHRYGRRLALAGVDLDIPSRSLVGVIGPDGIGKSTLLGLLAGVRRAQHGEIEVLGGDMASRAHRAGLATSIAYLPQGLGQHLSAELTVRENVDLFGRLFGVPARQRRASVERLLEATGLTRWAARPTGELSGGMRQKLGLCCSLIHQPALLVLDEPTTGIDPLSRYQLWELIAQMRSRDPTLSVVAATVYLEEAERFDWLVLMDAGRVLASGTPRELKARAGAASIADAYAVLLRGARTLPSPVRVRGPLRGEAPVVVEARGLTRRFGTFTAVDGVNFGIRRGEIFGFVGPNGSGKTTTLKMLIGLMPPSSGEARMLGESVRAGDLEQRRRVGYMSQGFSLYTELTVRQNLTLHARLFRLRAADVQHRVDELVRRFDLVDVLDERAEQVSLGLRQRLSLAVATIHSPEILILDEPTAGVDPLTRNRFWDLLFTLSRDEGVTILVSTHYLDEAARCDRVLMMHEGRVLASATPGEIVAEQGVASLEEAFIARIRAVTPPVPAATIQAWLPVAAVPSKRGAVRAAGRVWALIRKEGLETLRDRGRLLFSILVPPLLLLVYGFGYSFDIEGIPYAVADLDRSSASRSYLERFASSRAFSERAPASSAAELDSRLKSGEIKVAVEIPPGFGRDLRRGRDPGIGVWIDGTLPFRAEMARSYVEALHRTYLVEQDRSTGRPLTENGAGGIETRFRFNPAMKSAYAVVPGLFAVVLVIVPALLAGVAVARDRELGSIANLQATPVTRLEYFWSKQLVLVVMGVVGFFELAAMASTVFHVSLRGSLIACLAGTLLYVIATSALGLTISGLTRTQEAGLVGAAIITIIPAFMYSGLFRPVATLAGADALVARVFPAAYYRSVTVGTFTKGLEIGPFVSDYLALALIGLCLTLTGVAVLRKQAR